MRTSTSWALTGYAAPSRPAQQRSTSATTSVPSSRLIASTTPARDRPVMVQVHRGPSTREARDTGPTLMSSAVPVSAGGLALIPLLRCSPPGSQLAAGGLGEAAHADAAVDRDRLARDGAALL